MADASSLSAHWQVPRLRRDQRWLLGVAAAIAAELGVDALWIRLARRQERELREWLFGAGARQAGTRQFRAALAELAAEVEELHGLPVEVVVVGDVKTFESHASAVLRKLQLSNRKELSRWAAERRLV